MDELDEALNHFGATLSAATAAADEAATERADATAAPVPAPGTEEPARGQA